MRFLTVASLFSFLAASVVADEAPSDVISLTAADFESFVNAEPLILVEFFAPWCGHCKALAPHYEEAATALKEKNIKVAKVDCVAEADLCQAKGIQGYPTLQVYRNGESTEYNGPRKTDGIISYMVKQSLPAVSEVTADNHEEFKNSDKIVVIAYLSSPTDAPAPAFNAAAESHRDDYLFGLTTDKEAIEAAGVTPPTVVVYRTFDEPKTEYPIPISSLTKQDLENWLAELAIPLIDEVSGENYMIYANSPKPLGYLFIDPSLEDKETHIATVKSVAAKYKSQMNFVWIDAVKFGDHAKALNLAEAKWPAFVIQNIEKQLKYPYDQSKDVTAGGVESWVRQYLSGELQPQLKSQPLPTHQNEPVYVLVTKNFEEVAFDESKDVFIEFYASWCGHCKRLAPIWDSLGNKYRAIRDKIVIAKMEAQENDLPPSVPFRISGFPTLKFKPAGSREYIDYEGDRSFESLVAFVEQQAKNSLVLPDEPETPQVPLEAGNATTAHETPDEHIDHVEL